eukprot:TRINITY_DN3167_c0_g1_i1.p3 TRINITY_DN3167_c0_g1~~TRINITY_DN3167_c0_g1_i1.p3  ORF type:complete len:292 (-),score=72.30 TRINITY_DN3167_c0_g1_i1:2811-3686(-)
MPRNKKKQRAQQKSGAAKIGRSIHKARNKKRVYKPKEHEFKLYYGTEPLKETELISVTEMSSITEFVQEAEVAEKEFIGEKQNAVILTKDSFRKVTHYNLTVEQRKHYNELLAIPRRPAWSYEMTKEEVDRNEHVKFLNWRRGLALIEEEQHIMLTPYEKNLEIWRQLWRVVERSDVVVQIVDARNPQLRNQDLEAYVKEVDPKKENFLLVNKADLLTTTQRKQWAAYFKEEGIKFMFWSAYAQQIQIEEEQARERKAQEAFHEQAKASPSLVPTRPEPESTTDQETEKKN